MKLEIRDLDHAAILEKAFYAQEVIEFHGVSLAINERGYNFDGRSSWTFGFQEVHKAKWNGEGLPPVGTVCDFNDGCGGDYKRVEIMYVSSMTVLVKFLGKLSEDVEGAYSPHESLYFRPIRTPEQIAAEERASQIELMADIFRDAPQVGVQAGMAALYDAGYRK